MFDKIIAVWKIIKGTSKILKPDDDSALKDIEARKRFLNDNKEAIIINVNGNLYIGDYSKIPEDIKEKLLQKFKIEGGKKEDVD